MKKQILKENAQLAHWRNQKQYTQSELAAMLEVSPKTYWNYECGRSIPSASAFLALEQILGVPMRTLYESFKDYDSYIPLKDFSGDNF